MVLVPEIVDAVAPVPVIAAGGIGRGRQIATALALGAQGVWCGSVWLTTEEAETAPAVKDKFLAATSSDTVRSRYRTGKPARQLRSDWTDAWERPDAPPPLPTPFQSLLAEPALARSAQAALQPGSPAQSMATYFVGQIVGSMNRVQPTRRLVQTMIEEYIEATEQLEAWTQRVATVGADLGTPTGWPGRPAPPVVRPRQVGGSGAAPPARLAVTGP